MMTFFILMCDCLIKGDCNGTGEWDITLSDVMTGKKAEIKMSQKDVGTMLAMSIQEEDDCTICQQDQDQLRQTLNAFKFDPVCSPIP